MPKVETGEQHEEVNAWGNIIAAGKGYGCKINSTGQVGPRQAT
jgi:hypothetical protein